MLSIFSTSQVKAHSAGRCVSGFFGLALLVPSMWSQTLQAQRSLEEQVLFGDFEEGTSASPQVQGTPATADSQRAGRWGRRSERVRQQEAEMSTDDLLEESLPRARGRDLERLDQAIVGPRRIPRSHILVVQNQSINKAGRHEVTPFSFGVQPADSFRKQLQWGFGYNYHFTESFGLEILHAGFMVNFSSSLADNLNAATGLEIEREEPVMVLGSSVQWTPLRSKAAMLQNVYYFEGYFLGGGGTTRLETRFVPMAMVGVGFRAYLTESAILKLELRDYIEFKSGAVDHRVNIQLGAALLWGRD